MSLYAELDAKIKAKGGTPWYVIAHANRVHVKVYGMNSDDAILEAQMRYGSAFEARDVFALPAPEST